MTGIGSWLQFLTPFGVFAKGGSVNKGLTTVENAYQDTIGGVQSSVKSASAAIPLILVGGLALWYFTRGK